MQNELPPPKGEEAKAARKHAIPRARLKRPEEISAAAEAVNVQILFGSVSPQVAKTLQSGLKLQLDCTRSAERKSDGGSEGVPFNNAFVDAVKKNPEILQTIAPTLSPEELQRLLDGLGRES